MDVAKLARMRMRAQRLWGTHYEDPQDALRWLTAAQAQEFAYARWSLAQRTKRPAATDVDAAFREGRILRTHVLRPTWHFVAPQDLRWLIKLSGPRVNAANARRYRELELDIGVLARANDVIADAVADEPRTRHELSAILSRKGVATEGQRMAYILMRAELDAVICSGPIENGRHTYAAFDVRVPEKTGPDGEEALAELAGRFFLARGPATARDFAWWAGLPMADARRGLEMASERLESVLADARTYWFAPGASSMPPSRAQVDLVQCYDESIIAYSQSRDVLQSETLSFAVPRSIEGFVHVILREGQLLGHWKAERERGGATVRTRIQGELDDTGRTALTETIDRYRSFVTS